LFVALAYGALTSLNPVHGLYTSFFGCIIYVLFGTSRHLSVGTFSLTSLMVYTVITRVEQQLIEINNLNLLNESISHELISIHLGNATLANQKNLDGYSLKVRIATSLAFWCGIFQVKRLE
jgi:sulfate anion transporter 1